MFKFRVTKNLKTAYKVEGTNTTKQAGIKRGATAAKDRPPKAARAVEDTIKKEPQSRVPACSYKTVTRGGWKLQDAEEQLKQEGLGSLIKARGLMKILYRIFAARDQSLWLEYVQAM